MRNALKFPFVDITTETLGQLFISAVRYALRADELCLTTCICNTLRCCYLDDDMPPPNVDVIIEDLRRRHDWLRGSPTLHHDDLWAALLAVLAEPPDVHCARHGAPDGKIVSIKQNELVMLLSMAVNYALGRHTYIVGEARDWIRDLAPKLHRNDRASLASDIRCYLEKPRPDEHNCDEQSWRDALEFLNSIERRAFARSRPPKPRRR